jgi:copper homeostasis protein
MAKILEICVDSLASARAAIAGGADRLELCSALAIGGLTPYAELLKQIRAESSIPIRCLMRPRAGDFLYTAEEIQMMADQIRTLRALGADGFVIGCLTPDGDLDADAMEPLLEAAKGCGLTLHRCIDVSRDPIQTYLDAKKLGIDTVLTSGAAGSCSAGKATIGKLLALRDETDGPEVLIGAGVNASIIASFREAFPQARAFHMSGKADVESRMLFRRDGVPMGLPGLDEWHISQTDPEKVRAARLVLDIQGKFPCDTAQIL